MWPSPCRVWRRAQPVQAGSTDGLPTAGHASSRRIRRSQLRCLSEHMLRRQPAIQADRGAPARSRTQPVARQLVSLAGRANRASKRCGAGAQWRVRSRVGGTRAVAVPPLLRALLLLLPNGPDAFKFVRATGPSGYRSPIASGKGPEAIPDIASQVTTYRVTPTDPGIAQTFCPPVRAMRVQTRCLLAAS
jgi:hypothetical protein